MKDFSRTHVNDVAAARRVHFFISVYLRRYTPSLKKAPSVIGQIVEMRSTMQTVRVQTLTVPGEPTLSQGVQTHHQVAAVLLACHHHGLPQHLHAHLRASPPASVAR